MACKEEIAHIECACGEQFQVLTPEEDDWNEEKTAEAYHEHCETCSEADDQ